MVENSYSNKIATFKNISLEYFLNDLKNINDDLHREFEILFISYFNNNNGNEYQKQQKQTRCLNLLKRYIDEINFLQIFPYYFLRIQFAKRYNFEHKKPLVI